MSGRANRHVESRSARDHRRPPDRAGGRHVLLAGPSEFGRRLPAGDPLLSREHPLGQLLCGCAGQRGQRIRPSLSEEPAG